MNIYIHKTIKLTVIGSKPGVGYHDVFYTSSKSKRLLSEVAPEPSQDSFYNGCDIIKTCFGVPDGCVKNQNCVAVTSVSVQGQRYIISMQARGAAYVATGFSNDQNMVKFTVISFMYLLHNTFCLAARNASHRNIFYLIFYMLARVMIIMLNV